ncbi:MAG TPA: HD family hydrolase [Aestuariivirga sp.]|nr:HD family hydrolase [Aestuariivirga sp.]
MTAPRAWQRMLSGRRLDLLDPSPLDIEIADIAHGLARVARWNGQTRGDHAFSVAQHCVLVEALAAHVTPELTREDRLLALLHDAPEYVVGDMISPFKAALGLDYKAFENRLMEAIHMRFGLPPRPSAEVSTRIKQADKMAAFLEATQLAGFAVVEAEKFFGRPRGLSGPGSRAFTRLVPLAPPEASALYLKRFSKLLG